VNGRRYSGRRISFGNGVLFTYVDGLYGNTPYVISRKTRDELSVNILRVYFSRGRKSAVNNRRSSRGARSIDNRSSASVESIVKVFNGGRRLSY